MLVNYLQLSRNWFPNFVANYSCMFFSSVFWFLKFKRSDMLISYTGGKLQRGLR